MNAIFEIFEKLIIRFRRFKRGEILEIEEIGEISRFSDEKRLIGKKVKFIDYLVIYSERSGWQGFIACLVFLEKDAREVLPYFKEDQRIVLALVKLKKVNP